MSDQEEFISISVNQLRVGLYISLNLGWMDHPFLSNSFKISDEEQIKTIRRLGLKQVRYFPAKSSNQPLAKTTDSTTATSASNANTGTESESGINSSPEAATTAAETNLASNLQGETSPEEQAAMAAKKARIEHLKQHRQSVLKCEKELLEAAKTIKTINKNLFSQPKECVEAALGLVNQMVDSLLTEKDVAIHVMNDKVAGEDIYLHPLNVSILSMILAKELGLAKEEVRLTGMGSIFHDIGKTQIPDSILRKTEALTKPEQNFLAQHPAYGEDIGKKLGLSAPILDIIRHHHEQIDGNGYPDKLKGDQLSKLVRIVAIVNTFDNLCNHVNPLKSVTPHEAISYMFAKQKTQFDGDVMKAFIHSMGVYPPGTVIRLSNEMWGIVTTVNVKRPLKPTVIVYDDSVPKEEPIIIDLGEEPELSISKTFRPAQLPREVFDYLSPRTRITYYFDEATERPKN